MRLSHLNDGSGVVIAHFKKVCECVPLSHSGANLEKDGSGTWLEADH
jgi:hypothetical protein